MLYSRLCNLYQDISITKKRLIKIQIISDFLRELGKSEGNLIYLLMGRVFPDFDSREFGISQQILAKAMAQSFNVGIEEVIERFKKLGDLGDVAEVLAKTNSQRVLFEKALTVEKVFDNLKRLPILEGKGTLEKKIQLIAELYSVAKPLEAKYLSRTILGNLRVGISSPTIVDSLSSAFFDGEYKELIQDKYDLSNDFAEIFLACVNGKESLEKITLESGKPLNVMLAVKVSDIAEAFEVCGKPAAIERKYDGFRMVISKDKSGKISLFTRKLEEVTAQFPDVVERAKKNITGDSFILDSEVVGFDRKTKKYLPFEALSQRIKRKYEIERLIEELPVEINIFDCLSYDGNEMISKPFFERRRLIERIVRPEELKIKPALQLVTASEEEADKFFREALKVGEEGIMIKSLNAPYKQGRRVGFMCKLKPETNDLDLVIIGAEYGTGKRKGALTSFFLACLDGEDLLEVGRVSSGLKEKLEEGLTYDQMTEMLLPLIECEEENRVRVSPKIVVSVSYQNIQKSPSYSSGFALRFPRISRYRPDRSWRDIASLEEIKSEVKKSKLSAV